MVFLHTHTHTHRYIYIWRIRDQLDVTSYYILFHFFYVQHVSDINISVIRNLRPFYCITTLVVCSCVDVCWSFGVAGWSLLHGYQPNAATYKNVHIFFVCFISTISTLQWQLIYCVVRNVHSWKMVGQLYTVFYSSFILVLRYMCKVMVVTKTKYK